jgi:hypothetical protein
MRCSLLGLLLKGTKTPQFRTCRWQWKVSSSCSRLHSGSSGADVTTEMVKEDGPGYLLSFRLLKCYALLYQRRLRWGDYLPRTVALNVDNYAPKIISALEPCVIPSKLLLRLRFDENIVARTVGDQDILKGFGEWSRTHDQEVEFLAQSDIAQAPGQTFCMSSFPPVARAETRMDEWRKWFRIQDYRQAYPKNNVGA